MTLDEAIEKATRLLTDANAVAEVDLAKCLLDRGATDDELAATVAQSREMFAEGLRKTHQAITAIWFTDSARIH